MLDRRSGLTPLRGTLSNDRYFTYRMGYVNAIAGYPRHVFPVSGSNPTGGWRLSAISGPSRVICMSESPIASSKPGNTNYFDVWYLDCVNRNDSKKWVHRGRQNFLFLDGHLEALTKEKILADDAGKPYPGESLWTCNPDD